MKESQKKKEFSEEFNRSPGGGFKRNSDTQLLGYEQCASTKEMQISPRKSE